MPATAVRPSLADVDFASTPFIVIWEMTRACQLACLHCRASARPFRDSSELSTDEAMRLLDEIRAMGRPLVVLTGGAPLERPGVVQIVEYGTSIGLRMALTPSGFAHSTSTARAREAAAPSRAAVHCGPGGGPRAGDGRGGARVVSRRATGVSASLSDPIGVIPLHAVLRRWFITRRPPLEAASILQQPIC